MKKIGIWGVVLGAIAVSGCVSTSDIGNKNRQITEAESPLVFNGPGLENGYRKFTVGTSANHLVMTVLADYGPKSRRYPSANLMFRKLTDTEYHFYKVDLEEELQRYTSFKENLPALGEEQFYVNNMGRVDYVPFQHAGEHCIFFVQNKGRGTGSLGGNMRIQGFYCDTKPISRETAVAALASLDIRNEGRVIKVEKKVEAPNKLANLVGPEKSAEFMMGWDGVVEERKISVKYRLVSEVDGTFSFYTPATGSCNGDISLEKGISELKEGKPADGDWSFTCHKGQSGSGSLKIFSKEDGSANIYANGEDKEGNAFNLSS